MNQIYLDEAELNPRVQQWKKGKKKVIPRECIQEVVNHMMQLY